jgi:cell division septal protein FtsQ
MLQKRKLKKERSKYRIRTLLVLLICLSLLIVATEYLYLNFSFGRINFISPVGKIGKSKVASLESALYKKNISFASVNINSDGSFTVELKEGGEIILSAKKDLDNQLSSLQLILSRLTIEGKKLKKLDFRYDNPVVSF